MAGRGTTHEKTIGHLKGGLAFHTVPTNGYAADSAWQQLVALPDNLLTNLQIAHRRTRTDAARASTPCSIWLQTVQTLRFAVFHSRRHPRGRRMGRPDCGSQTTRQRAQRCSRIEKASARAA